MGRRKEAEDILAAAEKENGRCERDEDDKAKNEEKAEKAKNEEKAEKEGNVGEAEPAGNIFDLVRTPHLRKSTLIMYVRDTCKGG